MHLLKSYLDPTTFHNLEAGEPYAGVYVAVCKTALRKWIPSMIDGLGVPLDLPGGGATQSLVTRPWSPVKTAKDDAEYIPGADARDERKQEAKTKRGGREYHRSTGATHARA